jgi:hypothetical protein
MSLSLPNRAGRRQLVENLSAVFINLDGSHVRRVFMEAQLAKLGAKATRTSAVTPELADRLVQSFPVELHASVSKAESAIIFSWLAALDVAARQTTLAMVLEDDVELGAEGRGDPDIFDREFTKTLQALPSGWHVLHLGCRGMLESTRTNQRYLGHPWPRYPREHATFPNQPMIPGAPLALVLRPSFAATLAGNIRQWLRTKPWVPIDVLLARLYGESDSTINAYIANTPALAWEVGFPSDHHARRQCNDRERRGSIGYWGRRGAR